MKIGGANAPPTEVTKPQKRSFGRVYAAWLWPGGHSRRVVPPGFPVSALGFDKTVFDSWLQPLDLRRYISTDFQPL